MDKKKILKQALAVLMGIAAVIAVIFLSGIKGGSLTTEEKIPISILIYPKFEIGEMSGDHLGEAQLFYEKMFDGADEYEISGLGNGAVMYVKDGHALCLGGQGKVDSALTLSGILTDGRFDFSDAYIISTGCGGSAAGTSVMGDVVIVTAAVDYDLGHHADPREMEDPEKATWFHDDTFDRTAGKMLDPDLTQRVHSLTKDTELESTSITRRIMKDSFDGEGWASRGPMVIKGTDVTGDNYWKGKYSDRNARLIAETYGCPDPFAIADMEEIAVANTIERFGMLDRYIVIRGSVNMDVFLDKTSPEMLWNSDDNITMNNSMESLDIFPVAMKNTYRVVRTVTDAIDRGEL